MWEYKVVFSVLLVLLLLLIQTIRSPNWARESSCEVLVIPTCRLPAPLFLPPLFFTRLCWISFCTILYIYIDGMWDWVQVNQSTRGWTQKIIHVNKRVYIYIYYTTTLHMMDISLSLGNDKSTLKTIYIYL